MTRNGNSCARSAALHMCSGSMLRPQRCTAHVCNGSMLLRCSPIARDWTSSLLHPDTGRLF
jgi:hypothetical protein